MQLDTSALEKFGITTRMFKNTLQLFYAILADFSVCGSLVRRLSDLWVAIIVRESPSSMQHVKMFSDFDKNFIPMGYGL